jgi:hypothetical protein
LKFFKEELNDLIYNWNSFFGLAGVYRFAARGARQIKGLRQQGARRPESGESKADWNR